MKQERYPVHIPASAGVPHESFGLTHGEKKAERIIQRIEWQILEETLPLFPQYPILTKRFSEEGRLSLKEAGELARIESSVLFLFDAFGQINHPRTAAAFRTVRFLECAGLVPTQALNSNILLIGSGTTIVETFVLTFVPVITEGRLGEFTDMATQLSQITSSPQEVTPGKTARRLASLVFDARECIALKIRVDHGEKREIIAIEPSLKRVMSAYRRGGLLWALSSDTKRAGALCERLALNPMAIFELSKEERNLLPFQIFPVDLGTYLTEGQQYGTPPRFDLVASFRTDPLMWSGELEPASQKVYLNATGNPCLLSHEPNRDDDGYDLEPATRDVKNVLRALFPRLKKRNGSLLLTVGIGVDTRDWYERVLLMHIVQKELERLQMNPQAFHQDAGKKALGKYLPSVGYGDLIICVGTRTRAAELTFRKQRRR